MAHSAHFLERLDRVPRALTDFALGLYRDEDRLRWILHYAHFPKDEERVALALDPKGDGPYIVVTREGKFVTALGAEMTPRNLPILSRGQVDVFSARVDEARSRLELAREIVPHGKPPEDVMRLLLTRAWGLSREEFSAIAAWAPLFGTRFLADAYEHVHEIDAIRNTFLTHREKKYRKDPRAKTALDLVWNALHAMGSRFALAAMGDIAWADGLAPTWTTPAGPTYLATGVRIHSVAMRGAWAAARVGRPFIPVYKGLLSTPGDMFVRFDAALAMTAIGIRHARHRDEARRLVASMVDSAYDWNRDWTREIVRASERAFEDAEGATRDVAAHGAQVLTSSSERFTAGSPFRFEREEDVPRDLALLVAANNGHDSVDPFAFHSLPWVAKLASAEELYYPEEMERALRIDWTLDSMEVVYERQRRKPQPVIHEGPRLGRNDPCSCGSNAKFKRCCGR